MLPTKVLCHVEAKCPTCDAPVTCMGLAVVLPGGRIGDAEPVSMPHTCDACGQRQRRQVNAENRAALKRRKWAMGRPRA